MPSFSTLVAPKLAMKIYTKPKQPTAIKPAFNVALVISAFVFAPDKVTNSMTKMPNTNEANASNVLYPSKIPCTNAVLLVAYISLGVV